MQVKDKVVVVTGGARGIGRALCQRFAAEGARAVVVADIQQAGIDEVVGLISGQMNRGRRFMNIPLTAFIGMPGAAQGEVMP